MYKFKDIATHVSMPTFVSLYERIEPGVFLFSFTVFFVVFFIQLGDSLVGLRLNSTGVYC